jgi:omega-6 fatty acid desaturase (delta-12 desaturase)
MPPRAIHEVEGSVKGKSSKKARNPFNTEALEIAKQRTTTCHIPPTAPPPFSVAEVRAALPAELFERSAFWSFMYVLRDFFYVAVLGYTAYAVLEKCVWYVAIPGWILYTYLQGAAMTGIWVMAHECGHQAFSSSKLLNDTVGLVLHSLLLVPYHSWKISHAHHHQNTCSIENDEVFVPAERSVIDHINDSPLANLSGVLTMWLFGWPAYLVSNITGPRKYDGKAKSHFEMWSALFSPAQWSVIALSDVGLLAAGALIYYAIQTFSLAVVARYYFAPYLVVNMFLVTITYLQHTDTYIPHYTDAEFSWLRGALSTVDRSFGWLDKVHHHIADSHVAHHIFHTMPHYNAVAATPYLRDFLGDYYLVDNAPWVSSVFRSWSNCKYVDLRDGDIVYYKNANDLRAEKKQM